MRLLKLSISMMISFLFIINVFGGDLAKLPSGPDGPGPFGANYANLKYTPEWDQIYEAWIDFAFADFA